MQTFEEFKTQKLSDAIVLLEEARDAITALTVAQCQFNSISLTLADRMDEVGTRQFVAPEHPPRHIYHYCASAQLARGQIYYMDGIVLMAAPVLTMEQYSEVKKLIAGLEVPKFDPFKITILSLTPLGMETLAK